MGLSWNRALSIGLMKYFLQFISYLMPYCDYIGSISYSDGYTVCSDKTVYLSSRAWYQPLGPTMLIIFHTATQGYKNDYGWLPQSALIGHVIFMSKIWWDYKSRKIVCMKRSTLHCIINYDFGYFKCVFNVEVNYENEFMSYRNICFRNQVK